MICCMIYYMNNMILFVISRCRTLMQCYYNPFCLQDEIPPNQSFDMYWTGLAEESIWCLNEVAKELENPFGQDSNDAWNVHQVSSLG